MGFKKTKFIRMAAFFWVWAGSVYAATDGLQCSDFQKIFEFVSSEHLRFRSTPKVSALHLLQESAAKVSEELRHQGFHMLAAQFDSQSNLVRSLRKSETALKLCEQMPSGLHRAILMKAFVASLDPFSEFYLAAELPRRTSVVDGRFVGVGIGTEDKDPYIEVREVVESGPAEGLLRVGDLISHIDGYPVRGMDALELRRRMRGEIGSKVLIKGLREQQSFEVTVSRNQVFQKSVSSSWAEKGILQIKIHRFFAQTAPLVKEILDQEKSRTRGLILDLRDNPGGLLQAARELVDLFISKGVVLHVRGIYDDQMWAFEEGGYTQLPIVVLVNEKSASASEIVAGALQDYGRAVLVGSQTYGKSCIQNIYETKSGLGTEYDGGIKLTTLWYYLPSGRSVRHLTPDIPLASADKKEVERLHLPYEWPDQIELRAPFTSSPHQGRSVLRQLTGEWKPQESAEEMSKRLIRMMALSR